MTKPYFLITIDTEGDNLWSRPREITTANSAFLERFQNLCERHGFKPVYLTNYEMALCPVFHRFLSPRLKRGTAELGMHLHAWNSPPLQPLTASDMSEQPLLIAYPEPVLREKVAVMTKLLRERFETPVVSHRAGRWGFDGVYARALLEEGYTVDCSVTPLIDWAGRLGVEGASHWPDYSRCPHEAYFVDPADIRRPGRSELLEVPMTILPLDTPLVRSLRPRVGSLGARVLNRFYPDAEWLRPTGRNLGEMLRVLERARVRAVEAGRAGYAEFMLHSSEFMPGGSPTFPDAASVERLYAHLEQLFARAAEQFQGATLAGYRAAYGGAD